MSKYLDGNDNKEDDSNKEKILGFVYGCPFHSNLVVATWY